MTLENPGLSRRKLLRTTAIGVPAAGLLAFGSTLVTAPSANAIDVDGWWGSETSTGFQKFLNAFLSAGLDVDGMISSQPSSMASSCSGIVGGWEWVEDSQAKGSPTIGLMFMWLTHDPDDTLEAKTQEGSASLIQETGEPLSNNQISPTHIKLMQGHYGLTRDGVLSAPSQTIKALQKEINQYVG